MFPERLELYGDLLTGRAARLQLWQSQNAKLLKTSSGI